MKSENIEVRGGIVRYYGNKAGYIEGELAIVDTMFASPELSGWLNERRYAAEWQAGIYDRLTRDSGDAPDLKQVRIWQLKDNIDPLMKFIGYDEMLRDFGEPTPENYALEFDGVLDTNDLEAIFDVFNMNRPEGFTGHSLSMSDVVEFYDDADSEFHYVDRFGFKVIGFGGSEQTQTMIM